MDIIQPLPFKSFNIGDKAYRKDSHDVYILESIHKYGFLGVFVKQLNEVRYLLDFNEMSKEPPKSSYTNLEASILIEIQEKLCKKHVAVQPMSEAQELYMCYLECKKLENEGKDIIPILQAYLDNKKAKEYKAIQDFFDQEIYNKITNIKR